MLNILDHLNWNQDFGNGQAGHPVVLLDGVDADVAVSADVRVEDPGQEPDFRGVKGIRERDFQVEVKNSALVGAAHRPRYRGLPVVVRWVQGLSLDA